jgi:hypothetical protein
MTREGRNTIAAFMVILLPNWEDSSESKVAFYLAATMLNFSPQALNYGCKIRHIALSSPPKINPGSSVTIFNAIPGKYITPLIFYKISTRAGKIKQPCQPSKIIRR